LRSKINEEKLAEAYYRALELEKAGRAEEAAAAWREVLAIDPDDHGGAAIRLAAMGAGPVPDKAPEAYVETLFDQHAETFDRMLVEDLGYAVPLMTRQALLDHAPGRHARMLDLGCGTGLSGGAMRDLAGHITGVDISENMVAMADERAVYDELYVGEAVAFAEGWDEEPFDLVVATDVLPYLGRAERLFAGVARILAQEGVFAFSTETLPEQAMAGRNFMVGPHQRFAHAMDYIGRELERAGLPAFFTAPITVRHERGTPVAGHLILARKARI
jgi:predicted TPR repeat methyltransferase